MAQIVGALKQSFTDSTGAPLVGGKLYSYQAGTSTLLSTFLDQSQVTPNTNPIILDSRGECDVWIGTASYKFVLKDANDNTLWTVDNVSYLPDGSVSASKLAPDAINSSNLPAGIVTNSKLADLSVSSGKIQDLAILTAKIADNAITTPKIADSNVTTAKIADSNVTTPKIANLGVTTAKIADQAVILSKTPILGMASSGVGVSSTTSSTYSTMATVSFTTSGGYVDAYLYGNLIGTTFDSYIKLSLADGVGSARQIGATANITVDCPVSFSTLILENTIGFETVSGTVVGNYSKTYPPGAFNFHLGNLVAGTYTINLKWRVTSTGGVTPTLSANNLYFMVREQLARYS